MPPTPHAPAAETLWFLDTLVTVHVGEGEGSDGVSVLEHRAARGDSPPLHVHTTEDEVFVVLEGTFRFRLGEDERRAGPGDVLLAPKGSPHTYRVESEEGRWLTVTARGDFERFVRAASRAAERAEVPERGGPPSPEAVAALAETAGQYGIDLVGPPLTG